MNNFDTIYKENYQKMFCVGQKMINDREAVSDIVQEVFVYYYQKSQNKHPIEHLQSWLIRATINKCIDYSSRRKKHLKIDAVKNYSAQDDLLEQQQVKNVIHLALSKLGTDERKLVVLYSEGMTYKEIAQIADVRFASVGKMLSRSLKKLNEILKKLNYELY
ncbi:MAG: sigma-70 family RNA polymerase sigma factor [Bacteroidales bacterium]